MRGVQHTQRASKPAPRRYGSEANPVRGALPNQDTPEAINGRPFGELLAEAFPKLPPAPSSASGGLFRSLRRFLTPKQTARADFLDAQVAYLSAIGRRDTRGQRIAGKALVEAGKRRLMVGA